jgi:3D (Asp-Asp-Asp) domain-containing protein
MADAVEPSQPLSWLTARDAHASLPRTARTHTLRWSACASITHLGDRMPLVAAALVVSTLLHAGLLSFESALTSPQSSLVALSRIAETVRVVFEPDREKSTGADRGTQWVAAHTDTILWSGNGPNATTTGVVHQWGALQVVGDSEFDRLPVWDPSLRTRGWVQALDVGPIDPALVGSPYLPPIGRPVAWAGPARVTMYTCVELGGCNATASGHWPQPGMVAVDPAVIPLGSTVWIQGLGTFLAADTGSLVRGAHLDVYGLSYAEAIQWGVQERAVWVFSPQ